jgi:ribosome maturation factor RimP
VHLIYLLHQSSFCYLFILWVSCRYGSPTIDEIHQFSSSYSKRLEQVGEAGIIPKNLALEVSSPGAERVLHIPQDLERFKQLPMYVRYLESGEEKETEAEAKEKDGILELESVDTERGSSVWKLATVRINCKLVGKGRGLNKKKREWRHDLPFDSIRLVRLYIDL